MSKIIGILGGMGPRATADLFMQIIENTPANIDQEHLRIIIDNNPHIPSRIDAIDRGSKNPLPEMLRSAKLLEQAGADFLLIPCHTAHYWLPELQKQLQIPVYNMIEISASYITSHFGNLSGKILLLASSATIKKRIYQEQFLKNTFTILIPSSEEQNTVTCVISNVKKGLIGPDCHLESLNNTLKSYAAKGVSAIMAGCTEISLILPFLDDSMIKINPTLILAKKAVELAGDFSKKINRKINSQKTEK